MSKKNIKEYKGSFNEAYELARSEGLTLFKWNGGYYGTQSAEESKSPVLVGLNRKAKKELKRKPQQVKNGTNRYVTYKDGEARDIGTIQFNSEDTKNKFHQQVDSDDAIYAANPDMMPEIVVTANRTKIGKNDAGYVPIRDFGSVTLHQNINDKSYRVVDNRDGRIIAFAPAGTEVIRNNRLIGSAFSRYHAGNYGDEKGAKQTLRQVANADSENRTLLNENNQLGLLADQRRREAIDESYRTGSLLMTRTIDHIISTPNHAVMGAAKMALDPNYTWDNYKKGFLSTDKDLIRGLGDALNVENRLGNYALNAIDIWTLAGAAKGLNSNSRTVSGSPYVSSQTNPGHIITVEPRTTTTGRALDPTRGVARAINIDGTKPGSFVDNFGDGTYVITEGTRSNGGRYSLVNGRNQQVTTTGYSRIQSPRIIRYDRVTTPIRRTNYVEDMPTGEFYEFETAPFTETINSYSWNPEFLTTNHYVKQPQRNKALIPKIKPNQSVVVSDGGRNDYFDALLNGGYNYANLNFGGQVNGDGTKTDYTVRQLVPGIDELPATYEDWYSGRAMSSGLEKSKYRGKHGAQKYKFGGKLIPKRK